MLFAAVHESVVGTKRTFRNVRYVVVAVGGKADLEHTTLERAAPAAPFRIQRQAVGYLVPEFFGVGERRRKFQVVA